MDFLNRFTAQFRELFGSMTPPARVTAGLLLAVVAISVAYLFAGATPSPDAYLFGAEPLSSADIAKVAAAFSQAKLENYDLTGNLVRVPRAQKSLYMAAIAEGNALPRNFANLLDKMLPPGNPFESKDDKEIRKQTAKQEILSLWIRNMPEIEDAAVIYDKLEPRGLQRTPIVTASVTVWPNSPQGLNPSQKGKIRQTVAAAIAGLDLDNVTVTDMNGGSDFGGIGLAGLDTDDPYYRNRFLFEEMMRRKILAQLSYIRGVRVEVTAELDHTKSQTVRDQKLGEKKQSLRTSLQEESSEMNGGRPSQRPGVVPNTAESNTATQLAQATETPTNKTSRINETDESIPDMTITQKEVHGLTPQDIRAAIAIPSDHWARTWKERNRPADGSEPPEPTQQDIDNLAELQKTDIQDQVALLLGKIESGENPWPRVHVTTFTSADIEPIVAPAATSNAVAWAQQNWTTLAMFALAVFSLLMMRSMVRSVPPASEAPTFSVSLGEESHHPVDEAGGEEFDEDGRPRLKLRKGPNLKDDLAAIVREDPESAAAILRAWIVQAA